MEGVSDTYESEQLVKIKYVRRILHEISRLHLQEVFFSTSSLLKYNTSSRLTQQQDRLPVSACRMFFFFFYFSFLSRGN